MPRIKQDPLIAAMIAKLPKAGEDWPADKQSAWLHLMAMAFGTVYGGEVVFQSKQVVEPKQAAPFKLAHQFIIDGKGYAKNAAGKRILPKDVTGAVFDERGQDGDMRTIIWADETKGLNGADLVITA